MGITAAVVATAGAVYSADKQRSAAREAQRAAEKRERLNAKKASVASARERAKQVRMARAARASALAQAQTGEGTGGSGLTGAQANIGNQLTANMSFLNKNTQISKQLSDLNISSGRRIASLQGQAAQGGMVSSVATTAGTVLGHAVS